MSTIPQNIPSFTPTGQYGNSLHGIAKPPTEMTGKVSYADEFSELSIVSEALQSARTMRASMLSDSPAIQPENNSFSFNQIREIDVANTAMELAKGQILSQTGNGALARTNQVDQVFLALIK
ncbi:MAG: hypothetical protein FWG02_01015 [Holophagaceae bacterium]|nr:hypothetical protein [Holophagaceae bacterium]